MITKLEELEATIKQAQQQIEAIKNPKPAQWEPEGGGYWVSAKGGVYVWPTGAERLFGSERQTREEAEAASAVMRSHNRLLAYVAEFGGDWVADWSDFTQEKWAVKSKNEIRCSVERTLGTIYMSKDCAKDLAIKLSTGEVVL